MSLQAVPIRVAHWLTLPIPQVLKLFPPFIKQIFLTIWMSDDVDGPRLFVECGLGPFFERYMKTEAIHHNQEDVQKQSRNRGCRSISFEEPIIVLPSDTRTTGCTSLCVQGKYCIVRSFICVFSLDFDHKGHDTKLQRSGLVLHRVPPPPVHT